MSGHVFTPARTRSVICGVCGNLAGHTLHLYELPLMPDAVSLEAQRQAALEQAEGERLTARMREPGRNISDRAGRMEREAPLFFGTGDNPLLFGGQ